MYCDEFDDRSVDEPSLKLEVPSQACYVAVGADCNFAS
jgi:hypothetical protein